MQLVHNAGPALGTTATPAANSINDELVVERSGPHVLIRHRTEQPWESSVLTAGATPTNQVVVLASAAACRFPVLARLLPAVLLQVAAPGWLAPARDGSPTRVTRVWAAASVAGDQAANWSNWLLQFAERFDIEVLVPRGRLTLVPGGSLFVDATDGQTGWFRHRTRGPETLGRGAVSLVASRYPIPPWEAVVSPRPVLAEGLRADPVPAGLAVCDAAHPPQLKDLAFAVPMDTARPKLILGSGGQPATALPRAEAVAKLTAALHPTIRAALMIVPTAAAQLTSPWMRSLVDGLGHPVLLATGAQLVDEHGVVSTIAFDDKGNQLFRPFPTVLRVAPGTSAAEVVDVAPAPRGWSRRDNRFYQPDRPEAPVRAEVVPSGLLLGETATDRPAEPAEFDPLSWTVTIGDPGKPMTSTLLTGLRLLLAGLTVDQTETMRIRFRGEVDGPRWELCVELARQYGIPLDRWHWTHEPAPADVDPVTVALRPVPKNRDESSLPSQQMAPKIERTQRFKPVSRIPAAIDQPDRTERPTTPPTPPADLSPAEPKPAPVAASERAETRPSTTEEQLRFAAWAGPALTEALAAVDTALENWPALRQPGTASAKADLAAVFIYLRRGGVTSAQLNAGLRAGRTEQATALLPCLVSGLRLLPTQHRPVLRQGFLDVPARQRDYAPGTVLTEPGLLNASVALDIGTAEANVDFLVHPRTAHLTSALGPDWPVPQAVFPPGARFKVLAVRAESGDQTDPTTSRAPGTAVLLRELSPDEDTENHEMSHEDLRTLSQLDEALAIRRASPVRMLDDAEFCALLAWSLPGVPDVR